MDIVEEFNEYRGKMNEKILASENKVLKRIFNLDTNAFAEGALDVKTKELLGLACSMVLRCDDCVKYHLGKCHELGFTKKEIFEAMAIANLIGGTIVIPHLRRAVEYWEAVDSNHHD
ncbi:MAG: carboxymuconolactone decarboxylase family protein [Fulvivirga sp.]|nr:carboxymuconolactone decarboxylase family protein [Fulvivirga sp.]